MRRVEVSVVVVGPVLVRMPQVFVVIKQQANVQLHHYIFLAHAPTQSENSTVQLNVCVNVSKLQPPHVGKAGGGGAAAPASVRL